MFVTAFSSFPAVAIVFIICPITFQPTGKGLTKDLQDQLVRKPLFSGRICPFAGPLLAILTDTCQGKACDKDSNLRFRTGVQFYLPAWFASGLLLCSLKRAQCKYSKWQTYLSTTSWCSWETLRSRCSAPLHRQKFFPLRKYTLFNGPCGVSGSRIPHCQSFS